MASLAEDPITPIAEVFCCAAIVTFVMFRTTPEVRRCSTYFALTDFSSFSGHHFPFLWQSDITNAVHRPKPVTLKRLSA